MKRSAGVTTISILSFIGSAFMLLIGTLFVLAAILANIPSTPGVPYSPVFYKAMFGGIAIFHVLLAAWGITTGIGLLRLKTWARISTIVFSVLLILQSAFGLLIALVMPFLPRPTQEADPSALTILSIITAILALTLLGLGIWWLLFFLRKKVREQFSSARTMMPASPGSEGAAPSLDPFAVSAMPSPARRPLSFTIIAWFLLGSCIFIPLNVFLRAPAILLTTLLVGWPATLYAIAFLILNLYIGIGLLRVRLTARVAAIIYFCFGFVNGAIFYLAPGGNSRVLDLIRRSQEMYPWMQPWQNPQPFAFDFTPLIAAGACIGLAAVMIPVYFLITRKAAFEKAATALNTGNFE
jgi:hypothetical protein